MKLTPDQKLAALAHRFYSDCSWTPKAGDYYTTSRADLELYQVVSVEAGITRTRYTEGSDTISEWPTAGFLTEGFGPRRVHVPEWVMWTAAPADHEKVRLRAALQPFSDFAQVVFEKNFNNDDPVVKMLTCDGDRHILNARAFFVARAALHGPKVD